MLDEWRILEHRGLALLAVQWGDQVSRRSAQRRRPDSPNAESEPFCKARPAEVDLLELVVRLRIRMGVKHLLLLVDMRVSSALIPTSLRRGLT